MDASSHPAGQFHLCQIMAPPRESRYQWGQSWWNGSAKPSTLSASAAASDAAEPEGRWASGRSNGQALPKGCKGEQLDVRDGYGFEERSGWAGRKGENITDGRSSVAGTATAIHSGDVLICESLLQSSR